MRSHGLTPVVPLEASKLLDPNVINPFRFFDPESVHVYVRFVRRVLNHQMTQTGQIMTVTPVFPHTLYYYYY